MTDRASHISVLHLTDPHILETPEQRLLGVDTAYYLNAVLKHATSSGQHYDLCLVTGDLVQLPTVNSYRHLLTILEQYELHFTCLPGNHDNFVLMQDLLTTEKVCCCRHIILSDWQVLGMNSAKPESDVGELSQEELNFLEQQLTNHPELYSLIAVHHHSLPAISPWIDTMMIENAEEFLDILCQHKHAKLLVHGHIHQEMTRKINGLNILSSPSTCFQFKPYSIDFSIDNSSPGYRHIKLFTDGTFVSEVYRLPEPLVGLTNDSQGY